MPPARLTDVVRNPQIGILCNLHAAGSAGRAACEQCVDDAAGQVFLVARMMMPS